MKETKKCAKCGKEKNIKEFLSMKDLNKYTTLCAACRDKKKKRDNKYYQNNKAQANEQKSKYYAENKDDILKQRRLYYVDNKEYIKKSVKEYQKIKRQIDPAFRLRQNISSVIFQSLRLKNGSKFGHSVLEYLPFTSSELKTHLESQFESWMNWNNQGVYKSKEYNENDSSTWTWHIDHIIPQSKLPYVSMEDDNFEKCWALNNLRPLKSIDNIKKGSK